MRKLEQVETLMKKEKDRDKLCGFARYGIMQAAVIFLPCIATLFFSLFVYMVGVEDAAAMIRRGANFEHSSMKFNAPVVIGGNETIKSSRSQPVVLDPEVQALVNAIKEAAKAANGGSEPTWTEEEREEWTAQNPCRSRLELLPMYSRRSHVQHFVPNAQWNEVLREYSKLHRTCMRNVGNISDYFMMKNTSTGCKFLVADVMRGTGLGNKALVVLSNLLYAILTQRVVLVPLTTLLPFVMCEPFEGSSWRIDNSSLPYPPLNHPKLWQLPEYFYRDLDKGKKRLPYASAVTFVSKKIRDHWHPRPRFYCNTEQEHYSDIPWLYITGCLYTLPNLFAIGNFRPLLESLFPDKMALTHLLRSVMLPGDTVWDRVQRINDAYLGHADRRVGIQVRYKDGLPHYNEMNDLYNERITQCAIENNILPRVNFSVSNHTDDSHTAVAAPSKPRVVMVFIACLYTGLHDHLTRLFLRNPTTTGESVGLVQVTHEDVQDFGVEVDRQALAEVITLSFSDDLFVTPISTYGGMAQAYGALKPWFIEIRKSAPTACTRGRTVDICYQGGSRVYECPRDEDVNGKRISHVVPYLTPCLAKDFPKGGVQLITSSE